MMSLVTYADVPGAATGPDPDTRGDTRARPGSRVVTALWAVVHLSTSLLTACAALVLIILAVTGVSLITVVGIGLLLTAPALWGAWALGRLERHRILAFLGTDIGERAQEPVPPWRHWLGLDGTRLRAFGWASLHLLWGGLSSLVILALLSQGLLLATVPLWRGNGPVNLLGIGLLSIDPSPAGIIILAVVGLGLLLLTPVCARGMAGVDIALARWLIGADPQAQLLAMQGRVDDLTTARSETLDSVEAERRRIERDLHDGPQQRLVSVAMNLGLARDTLERDPSDPRAAELVRDLLAEAHTSSKEAVTEMRQVARGIVPPILTDRGLDAAVSALADRSPVPVAVTSDLAGRRLPATVETVAYFSISEALTNVAKHASARRATVSIAGPTSAPSGGSLVAVVADDGIGGATPGHGTGLTGLRQRLGAVDGTLDVHSPVGAGTRVTITIPVHDVPGDLA